MPRHLARGERPRCCCMRQPGVQDTGDGKKKKTVSQNECVGGKDVPPRLGSMWTSLACPVRCGAAAECLKE